MKTETLVYCELHEYNPFTNKMEFIYAFSHKFITKKNFNSRQMAKNYIEALKTLLDLNKYNQLTKIKIHTYQTK